MPRPYAVPEYPMTLHTVHHGNTPITFDLSYADRKTLGITVHPEDLRVAVTAPSGTPLDAVLAHVAKRAPWIPAQQTDLARYWPPVPPRRYVAGASHL